MSEGYKVITLSVKVLVVNWRRYW